MTDRAALIEKINRLRELRTDRGCTEAEANAAAAKVAQLMREAQLSEDDLEISEKSVETAVKQRSKAARLFGVIGFVTNCVAVEKRNGVVLFVGRDPGPEIAQYLLDVCETAVRIETDLFKRSNFYRSRRKTTTRRKAIADFQVALINRLTVRLYDLFKDTLSNVDLASARQAVERRMNVVDIRRSQHKIRFGEAALHGQQAGNGVGLHHGMNTGQAVPKQIGGAA